MRESALLAALLLLAGCGDSVEEPVAKPRPPAAKPAPPTSNNTLPSPRPKPVAEEKKPAPPPDPFALLLQGLNHAHPKSRRKAADELAAMGPQAGRAQPNLIRALRDPHPDVKSSVQAALAGLGEPALAPMIELLSGPDGEQRSGAAAVLRRMGPIARPAGPALVKALFDSEREDNSEIHEAVAAQGRAVVPALVEKLRGGSYGERVAAAMVLGRMGPEAVDALPDLEKAGRDPRQPSNVMLESYLRVRAQSRPLAQILADVQNGDPVVRREALQQIAALGPRAKDAIPILLPLLQQPLVPDRLPEALRSIGPDAFAPLVELLKTDDPGRATMVAASISTRDVPPGQALPLLTALLKDAPRHGRRGALRVLASLGPHAEPAIPQVAQLLPAPDLATILAVVEFLVATRSPEAVAPLAGELQNSDPECRRAALSGLERVHSRRSPALGAESALRDALAVSDAGMRRRIEALLRKIDDAKSPGQLDPLQQAISDLSDHDPEVQRAAVDDLAAMGPAAKDAAPGLFRVVRTAHRPLMDAASAALLAMGPAAVPELSTPILQRQPDTIATQRAVAVLCRMEAPATEALKVLCDGLALRSVYVDRTLLGAFRRLAPHAVPLLVDLLEHGSLPGKEAAASALCALGDVAKDALPALDRAEKDPALAKVAPTIRAALRTVSRLAADLGNADPSKRIEAAHALASLGPKAKEAAPALVETILSGKADGQVFGPVRNALQRIGSPAYVPILRSLQDRRAIAPHVVDTLLEPIEAPPEAFPLLGTLLKAQPLDEKVATVLLRILERLGSRAQGQVPDAIPLLKSGNDDFVRGAINFLASTGSNDAVRPLAGVLKHQVRQLRLQAISGLATLGERGADLRPAEKELREALADPQLKPGAERALLSLESKKK